MTMLRQHEAIKPAAAALLTLSLLNPVSPQPQVEAGGPDPSALSLTPEDGKETRAQGRQYCLLFHSFNKYLLSAHHEPGPDLGNADRESNQERCLPWGVDFPVKGVKQQSHNKQLYFIVCETVRSALKTEQRKGSGTIGWEREGVAELERVTVKWGGNQGEESEEVPRCDM